MKSLFILVLASFATLSVVAQKTKTDTTGKTSPVQTQYTCPMHPGVVSNAPGKCPKCKMDLVVSPNIEKAATTTTYRCPMHEDVVANQAGKCPRCKMDLVVDAKTNQPVTTTYTCPMHPEVKAGKPGKCPVCHMDLEAAKTATKKN